MPQLFFGRTVNKYKPNSKEVEDLSDKAVEENQEVGGNVKLQ